MVEKRRLRFEVGDWIVHASYGVGKVVDIVDKDMDGIRETYFKVSTADIEYWLPINKADAEHITPIRSQVAFEEAIKIIASPPEVIPESQNQYKRRIYERWLDGSLPARAALLRDLHGKNDIKALNYDEKEFYKKIEDEFITEWLITNPSLSHTEAKNQLNEALAISIQNR